jgi:hypothetical protein
MWMSLKLPSWFPIQTLTEEKQLERDKAEALERYCTAPLRGAPHHV